MKAAVPNGIREKSQLLARAAGNGHEVQLRRLGKARRDQDFMPGGMPVGKARAAKRRITSRCFRQRTRNFGNPVNYQAFRGCEDRKSTRLNSSHVSISYAVFCLKKKK